MLLLCIGRLRGARFTRLSGSEARSRWWKLRWEVGGSKDKRSRESIQSTGLESRLVCSYVTQNQKSVCVVDHSAEFLEGSEKVRKRERESFVEEESWEPGEQPEVARIQLQSSCQSSSEEELKLDRRSYVELVAMRTMGEHREPSGTTGNQIKKCGRVEAKMGRSSQSRKWEAVSRARRLRKRQQSVTAPPPSHTETHQKVTHRNANVQSTFTAVMITGFTGCMPH